MRVPGAAGVDLAAAAANERNSWMEDDVTISRSWLAALITLASTSAHAQLLQITSCVEVGGSPLSSTVARGRGVDCDPRKAMAKALSAARRGARDVQAPTCISRTPSDVAEDLCASVGGDVPGPLPSLPGPSFPANGRPSIDAALPIGQDEPKLCVVLRDNRSGNVVTIGTRDNFLCIFNGFRETVVSVTSEATCGAQCIGVPEPRAIERGFDALGLDDGQASSSPDSRPGPVASEEDSSKP